jgi:ubiquinone biosynthesis protein COQ9
MRSRAQALSLPQGKVLSIKDLLEERLKFNDPVLEHLSEAFALLASSSSLAGKVGPFQVPPIDPLPILQHAIRIADEACYLTGDTSTEV